MVHNGIKLSQSMIDLTIKEDPELAPYIEKIKAIDGEVTLAEVAKVVKELQESNEMRSYMRKIILAIIFIFILLAVTMVVSEIFDSEIQMLLYLLLIFSCS